MNAAARLLVVDDEPDVEALVRQKFRREIRQGAMEFLFASDGQEALDVLETDNRIVMVLSDINMPGMDGLTLLSHLAERHAHLKTIVVSAYGDMKNIRIAMNRGAFDFVTKPIEFTDLEATIRKALDHLAEVQALQHQKAKAEVAVAALSRYFSPKVIESMASQDADVTSGQRREATFLFTDLTDFTHLVETTKPDEIVTLLNEYIDSIARIVFANDGTVMKIIGDSVQIAFGVPISQEDHAERAVKTALEIDVFAEEFRKKWREKGVALGATRIGAHSGDAIIGNFGGDAFFDYTAYGNAVNTAARLESANKALGTRICVSQQVVDRIPNFHGRPAGDLQLHGLSSVLTGYEPLLEDIALSAPMQQYREAYQYLAESGTQARAAFAALMGLMPEDPLTLLHLQRTLSGSNDTIVEISAK